MQTLLMRGDDADFVAAALTALIRTLSVCILHFAFCITIFQQ